jgi:hypothetical protein
MWSEAIMANVKELRQLYQVAISTTLKNFAWKDWGNPLSCKSYKIASSLEAHILQNCITCFCLKLLLGHLSCPKCTKLLVCYKFWTRNYYIIFSFYNTYGNARGFPTDINETIRRANNRFIGKWTPNLAINHKKFQFWQYFLLLYQHLEKIPNQIPRIQTATSSITVFIPQIYVYFGTDNTSSMDYGLSGLEDGENIHDIYSQLKDLNKNTQITKDVASRQRSSLVAILWGRTSVFDLECVNNATDNLCRKNRTSTKRMIAAITG